MTDPDVRYQYEVAYWTFEQAEALPDGLPMIEEEER